MRCLYNSEKESTGVVDRASMLTWRKRSSLWRGLSGEKGELEGACIGLQKSHIGRHAYYGWVMVLRCVRVRLLIRFCVRIGDGFRERGIKQLYFCQIVPGICWQMVVIGVRFLIKTLYLLHANRACNRKQNHTHNRTHVDSP
jgi:hypothetical protein